MGPYDMDPYTVWRVKVTQKNAFKTKIKWGTAKVLLNLLSDLNFIVHTSVDLMSNGSADNRN